MTALALAPATASAAGLIAAYDHYVAGQGFQIGLVNPATGAALSLPAGVNTPDDELHPALSPDGRYLTFTRMKLQPLLDGNVIAPAERRLVWADRQTGSVVTTERNGVGPVITARTASSPRLSWGLRGARDDLPFTRPEGRTTVALTTPALTSPPGSASLILQPIDDAALDVPHAGILFDAYSETVAGVQEPRHARYLSLAYSHPSTGVLRRGVARLASVGKGADGTVGPQNVREFGGPGAPAGHPVPRIGDGHVALDRASGSQADIHTIAYPGPTQTTAAPAPVTTNLAERMPAWSPDGA